MDLNLTGAIATNVSLIQPSMQQTKTDYLPIIGQILIGLFTLIGVVIVQYIQYRSKKRTQQEKEKNQIARLIDLESLLKANKETFTKQSEDVVEFLKMLKKNHPKELAELEKLTPAFGRDFLHEFVLSIMFPMYLVDEQEVHNFIRNQTIYKLRVLNNSLLKWIEGDTYFKANLGRNDQYNTFSEKLSELHTHLLLWQSKYDMSIPEKPENALVYVGTFPGEIDKTIQLLKNDIIADAKAKRWWQFWK